MPTINLSELPASPTELVAWLVTLALIAYGYIRQRGLDGKYGDIAAGQDAMIKKLTTNGLLEPMLDRIEQQGRRTEAKVDRIEQQVRHTEDKVDRLEIVMDRIERRIDFEKSSRRDGLRDLRREFSDRIEGLRAHDEAG